MLLRLAAMLRLALIHPALLALAWKLRRRKLTYLSYHTLWSLARNYQLARRRQPEGPQVAEFGVGRGGSARLLAWLVGRYGGRLVLFDLFGRIPAPGAAEGAQAQARYDYIVSQEDPAYYGNIPNLLDVVRQELSAVCSLERVEFVAGKYEETLPQQNQPRQLALVHIDCDWYESSKAVYAYLQTNLAPGALIQIDDYSMWPGSQRAFSETEWLRRCQQRGLQSGALVVDTAA
jgi:hypothetical protein